MRKVVRVPQPPADPSPFELTRRQALGFLATLPLGSLAACGSNGSSGGVNASKNDLEQMLAAVRQSPDHLTSRAAAAVSTKDAQKITRFVRDAIAVLPPPDPRAVPEIYSLWGSRGTLRGGAGVLRDRADLLAKLLGDAGFQTKVVAMTRPASLDEATLYAAKPAAFSPDSAALRAIYTRQHIIPTTSSDDPATDSAVAALAQQITSALPSGSAAATRDVAPLPDTIPIVEYVAGGMTAWAVALGDSDVVTERPPGVGAALDDAVSPKVTVSVAVALKAPIGAATDPTALTTVVEASYAAKDLVGRQLLLGCPPPGDPKTLLGQDFSASPTRIPTLRLMSPDDLPADAVGAVSGKPLLMSGAVLDVSDGPSPTVTGPFGPLTALDASAHADAVARASALDGSVSASAFPVIELDLSLRDASNLPVNGLGASDFAVTEEGQSQAISVVLNGAPAAIRVLVIYDTSGSIANSWPTPADRAAFEAKVANAIAGAAADKPFEVQVVGIGATPTTAGWRTPDATTLASDLASIGAATSDVWYSLGQMLPASGASVALMLSDDASSLEDPTRIDEWKRNVGADAIPIGVVPLGTVDDAATQFIVDSSGGARLDPTSATFAADLTAFLKTHAGSAAVTNYRVRYRTTETGPATRHVAVKLATRPEIAAALTYTVPAAADRTMPSGIAGLYVTVTVGSVQSVRKIAGADVSSRGAVILPLAANAVDETTTALACMHTVMFEPTRPTMAHLYDDALSALITQAEFVPQANKGADAFVAALPKMKAFPIVAPLLFEAPAAASDPPLATGLRVAVLGSRFDGKELVQLVDVVPEFNVWTSTGDAATRFNRALARSLYISAREAQFCEQSAFADLQGTTWAVLAPGAGAPASWTDDIRARFRAVLDQYSSWICLVPADGATPALWVVDPATGSATAVSLDGRGGGSDPGCKPDSDLVQMINAALIYLSVVCTIGSPEEVTPWAQCISANVFGIGVLAYGSFTSPAGFNFNFGVGLVGAIAGFAKLKGINGAPPSLLSRAVLAMLQAMLGVIGLGVYC